MSLKIRILFVKWIFAVAYMFVGYYGLFPKERVDELLDITNKLGKELLKNEKVYIITQHEEISE